MNRAALFLLERFVADLEEHADGNPGDGCWALHDKWRAELELARGFTGERRAAAMRQDYAAGMLQVDIAAKYGVSQGTVSKVVGLRANERRRASLGAVS